MKNAISIITLLFILLSCSNAPELETGEIKILQLLKSTFGQIGEKTVRVDARNLLTRTQVDIAKIPILFVELDSGQNGTLTPYPGKGVGQTWLGADGATITLDQGILKASRGMGDDIMGGASGFSSWEKITGNAKSFTRKLSYLSGDNKIYFQEFKCRIRKNNEKEFVEIWDVTFLVTKFTEECHYSGGVIGI